MRPSAARAEGLVRVREIGSQPSYLSQNALEAHFGLGPARQVDRVRVYFADGGVRELKRLAPNQAVTVEE